MLKNRLKVFWGRFHCGQGWGSTAGREAIWAVETHYIEIWLTFVFQLERSRNVYYVGGELLKYLVSMLLLERGDATAGGREQAPY